MRGITPTRIVHVMPSLGAYLRRCLRAAPAAVVCVACLCWAFCGSPAVARGAPAASAAGPLARPLGALGSPLGATADSVTVDHKPLAELTASDSEGGLGTSVAITEESRVVAGTPRENDGEGLAYVFGSTGGTWSQQADVGAGEDGVIGGGFGRAVAIAGNTMVVGAPGDNGSPAGKAFILTYSEAKKSWSQAVELAPEETGRESNFGASVAISANGETVVVGAPGENGDPSGKVYVFTGSGASWSTPTELAGPDENRDFGASVAISGETVVVGDPRAETPRGDPSTNVETGAAYAFTGSGASWSKATELVASDGAEGDEFAKAIAISGSTLLVGAPGHANEAGAAYVFTGSGASWAQKAELTAGEASASEGLFGEAVAISSSGAIVGAPGNDSGAGAAYVFTGAEGSWTEQSELNPATRESEAGFGDSLSVSGATLAVGAPGASDEVGAAYVYALAPPPLSITAFVSPSPVKLGEDLTNRFTITDTSTEEAKAVVLTDGVPGGATLKLMGPSQGSCDEQTASCALGSIEAGKTAIVEETLEPTRAGVLANTATVTSSNLEGASATAETTVQAPTPPAPPCESSRELGAVTVLADCISEVGGGTYLASGNTRFSDGAAIVTPGTESSLALILDPATNTISITPGSGAGELEVGGRDVATGRLAIDTQGEQDPVSGVAGAARITGMESVALSLSGWTFEDLGVAPSVYLLPSGAGGGVVVDGRLTLPYYLGSLLDFGSLSSIFSAGVTGQLAVQVAASGAVSVRNGGVSVKEVGLPYLPFAIKQAQLEYAAAGDRWTGSGTLVTPEIANLVIDPLVISDGKLDELVARFQCAKYCSGGSEPKIGNIIEVKDINLEAINLQGIDYTPPSTGPFGLPKPVLACHPTPTFHFACPAIPPPPQFDGEAVFGVLGGKIIAGGAFKYLLDGDFLANGEIAMAPLYGGHFPIPTGTHGLEDTLSAAKYGINIATGAVSFEPPHTLTASGTMLLPPLPSPQFLKGTISIGVDPPHFTGEGSLDLIVPPGAPILGGANLGGVTALVSDEAAAGEVSASVCVPRWLFGGGCYTQSLVIAYVFSNGSFQFDLDGDINDYATVAQAASSARAGANTRTVRVPSAKRFASFTISSARGTPDVELISPIVNHRRLRLTLAGSRARANRTGALASVSAAAHQESFLVALPPGGSWTVRRLQGPKIASVRVSVARRTHAAARPRLTPAAGDLPHGVVSTSASIALRYSVPGAPAGTRVELWASTQNHGAGGTMIADELPPSGSVSWKLAGLASGRYWPYAIISEHGVPVAIEHWPRAVQVSNPAAPALPTGVESYEGAAGTEVVWNAVSGASSYAITATPRGGGAPLADAVPASQLQDTLSLAAGKWSITVQAVSGEDLASLPSAASAATVP